MSDKPHHPFSPSKLGSLEQCPHYENRDSASIAAATGVLQHRVAETGADDMRLSDDEALASASCLDFIEHQKALLGDGVLEIKERYLPIDGARLEWAGQSYEGTTGGYCDVVLISGDRKRAVLIDFKFGVWAVEPAKSNPQGMAYLLGAFRLFPALEAVQVFFLQPKLDSITEATFTRADIPRLYARIVTIVARAVEAQTKTDFSLAKPSYPNCLFCREIGRCPAIAKFALDVSKKFYPLSGVPEDITPTQLHSPAEAATLLRVAGIVETWSKAIRSQVTDRSLRDGVAPDGYKLTSRTPRKIADKKAFRAVALKFLTEEELFEATDYTFGPVETKVKDSAPRGHKKAALEDLDRQWKETGAVVTAQTYVFLAAKQKEDAENVG